MQRTTTALSALILIGALVSAPAFADDIMALDEPGADPLSTTATAPASASDTAPAEAAMASGATAAPNGTAATSSPAKAAAPAEAAIFRQEGIASWYGAEFEGRLTASGERFDSRLLTAAHPTLPFGTMLKITNRQNGKSVVVRVNDRGPFVAARILDVSRGAAEVLDMVVTGTAPIAAESLEPVALNPASIPVSPAPQAVASAATIAAPAPAAPVPAPPVPVVAPAAPVVAPPSVTVDTPAASLTITAQTPAEVPKPAAIKPAAAPAKILPAQPNPANGKFYRLQVGSYRLERNAAEAFDKLAKAGLSPAYERNGEYFRVVLVRVPSAEIENRAILLGSLGFREILARQE